MATVPPKLEAAVQFLLPPACREEVLGDLCERYTGPGQYIGLAMRVVPFVIASRIRRTTDALILLTEALLIYCSYLAAAWYTDRTLLFSPWGLVWLAVPTVLQLAVLILEHAWEFELQWPMRFISGGVIGISIAFNVYGACASMALVAAVEILFRPGANPPRRATGPAPEAERAVMPFGTKFSLAVVAVITVEAIVQALTGVRPWIVGMVLVIVFVAAGLQLRRSRKE